VPPAIDGQSTELLTEPTSAVASRRNGRPNWMLSVRVASSEYAALNSNPISPMPVSQRLLRSIDACGFVSSAKSP